MIEFIIYSLLYFIPYCTVKINKIISVHVTFSLFFFSFRYLMYYWPVLSAIVGVGMNFLFLVTTVGLLWFYESTKTSNSEMPTGESSHTFMGFFSRNRTIGILFFNKCCNLCISSK